MANNKIPRRIRIDLLTPAEVAIREAIIAVENAGADVRLTESIGLLTDSKNKVADYVDEQIKNTL